jgi:aquaporin Z
VPRPPASPSGAGSNRRRPVAPRAQERDVAGKDAHQQGRGPSSTPGGVTRFLSVESLRRRLIAEGLGTFWLVLGGCGSAVLAATFPGLGIGFHGVALAFGLTVVTGAYALGPISGGHFNPAVTVGAWTAGRFAGRDVPYYLIAQVVGGIAAAIVVFAIAAGQPTFSLSGGLASNGYGAHSPGGYSLAAGLLCELVMTFMFLMVILGATDKRAPQALAPLAIGLALTLIHLVSIPVTNTSVNPARSTGPAVLVGGWALRQLWLFWLAPLAGGAAAGIAYRRLFAEEQPSIEVPASRGVPPVGAKPRHST